MHIKNNISMDRGNTLDDLREGNIDIDNIPEPHASDYRYILEKSPQNKADIIFERLEENI